MSFPSEFPSEAFQLVINNLTGSAEDSWRDLIEAGYDVEGYALSVALPEGAEPPAPVAAKSAATHRLTKDQKVALLQKAADQGQHHGTRAAAAAGFDWSAIIGIVTSLIQQWLSGTR